MFFGRSTFWLYFKKNHSSSRELAQGQGWGSCGWVSGTLLPPEHHQASPWKPCQVALVVLAPHPQAFTTHETVRIHLLWSHHFKFHLKRHDSHVFHNTIVSEFTVPAPILPPVRPSLYQFPINPSPPACFLSRHKIIYFLLLGIL